MKKLAVTSSIAIGGLAIALVVFITKPNIFFKHHAIHHHFPPNGITLNGVQAADADEMCDYFIQENSSSDASTAIFLNLKWVQNIYRILTSENDDGFRIYFAKTNEANPLNTVVIVSTQNHQDYLVHSDSFFNTADKDFRIDRTGDPDLTGATLYKPIDPTHPCVNDACNIDALDYMDCKEAHADVINFVNQNAKHPINTYSEWFPKGMLENIKNELEDANLQGVPADGIRVYFALNGKTPTNPDNKHRHTFIIVTTQLVGNIHQDYYKCYNKHPINTKTKGTNDNGELCPYNCN